MKNFHIRAALAVTAFVFAATASAQNSPPFVHIPTPAQPGAIPLYPNGAPPLEGAAKEERWNTVMNERVVRNVTIPTITPYLPDPAKATGAAVVVAPGGGFLLLSIDNEGHDVAKWFAAHGVAAFVLKYRVQPSPADEQAFAKFGEARMAGARNADAETPPPPTFKPAIDDGIAAVRFVRQGAAKWGVDPKRIGMVGFSAGAMNTLGTTLANQPGGRPDFVGLIYGPMFPAEVSADAPPLFSAIAADDPLFGRSGFGLIENWRKAGRPVEFHLYQKGGHGFGMRETGTTAALWPEEFLTFMKTNGLLGTAVK